MKNGALPLGPTILRWFALVALLLAASFAPGTMPRLAVDGSFVIELCTGDGIQTLRLNADGSTAPASDSTGDTDHLPACAWAALAALTAPDLALSGILPAAPDRATTLAFAVTAPTGLGPIVPFVQSRAPPAAL